MSAWNGLEHDEGDDPILVDRLAQALECLERGEAPDLQVICSDCPDLVPELAAALEDVDRIPSLHREVAGFDPLEGTVVSDRYLLLRRIGSGGMGVVYGALDRQLGREVAIKMLRPELAAGAELEARLVRESEVLASVRHDAIVTVHDRGHTADGRTFLVMELLEGRGANELLELAGCTFPGRARKEASAFTAWLRELLPSADLETSYVRQAVRWIAEVARGLDLVHRKGVVHRDVKPSNVFVQRDGRAVLIDFGIVTLGPDATLAMREAAMGTPAYMAPELLDLGAAATPQSDVYGLTATLYHLLTFQRPFSGTPPQVLAALQRRDPQPAYRLRPGLPRDLQAILDMGMARQPKERYASAAELADDLQAWLDVRAVQARPLSTVRRTLRRMRRNPVVRIIATATLLSAVTLGAYQTWVMVESSRSAAKDALWRAWCALWAQVPSSIIVADAPLRVGFDPESETAISALLDELVACAPEASPSRIVRAGYSFDRGRMDEALRDMEALDDAYGTRMTRAFRDRYRAVAEGSVSTLSLDDLPDALGDVDRFLLAYHLFRNEPRDLERAASVLDGCTGNGYGVEELRLLVPLHKVTEAMPRSERIPLARRVYEAGIRLEESPGRASALTANAMGRALILQGLFTEASAVNARGTERSPHDFVLWLNAGTSQFESNPAKTGTAQSRLERAVFIQPQSVKAREYLVWCAMAREDVESANAMVDTIPYGPDEDGRRKRLVVEARILIDRAVAMLAAQELSEERQEVAWGLAERAYQKFYAATDTPEILSFDMVVALGIATGEPRWFHDLATYIRKDPQHRQRLLALVALLPEDLTPAQTSDVRDVLIALIDSLAPDTEPASR